MNRKNFLKSSLYLGGGLSFISCLSDHVQTGIEESNWNDGEVAHILPTVNHNRILVSTSYKRAVKQPTLKNKESLCDPWQLKTFPAPNADVQQMKLMIYTCAGGHPEGIKLYPLPEEQKEPAASFAERRVKLLHRGLSFNPDALIIIGDTVYWDLTGNGIGRHGFMENPKAREIAPKFDKTKAVLGTENEDILKKAVGPQIIDLYGTACRSTPVFFFNDDHDYFENDEANDTLITFPPKPFQLELARTVQRMYTPEFLPDENRPLDLPGSGAADRVPHSSEAFGTLRFGRLAEFLMYDCRRFMTLDADKAQFIPASTEHWLHVRTASKDVKHTFNLPSTPFGWSAGKWGEWYPDILHNGQLNAEIGKPYWQKAWLSQHDRILQSMYSAKYKKPIMISGDLHALASGRIYRNGAIDMSDNPIHCFLSGPLANNVFPSTFRKIKASSPNVIGIEEDFENIEENGFSIVNIDSRNVTVKMFKFLWSRDVLNNIPELQSFRQLIV